MHTADLQTDTAAVKTATVAELVREYPYLQEFLAGKGVVPADCEEKTLSQLGLAEEAMEFIDGMAEFLGEDKSERITSISIQAGTDKDGAGEPFGELQVSAGEIVCIVGPTGSGKSRLLADIEWMAQADTPTSRRVLVNESEPDLSRRFGGGPSIVAQLSQNMNFVMDVSVSEFLALHAESRFTPNAEEVCRRVIETANELAGESFSGETQLTALSGGQARSLMIADTAILSSSPVVLIDEIENAGIDRLAALEVLTGEEKIVLMATHDPMLALKADKRLVIENGGIREVLESSAEERVLLEELVRLDRQQSTLRSALRRGERVGPHTIHAHNATNNFEYNSTGGMQ